MKLKLAIGGGLLLAAGLLAQAPGGGQGRGGRGGAGQGAPAAAQGRGGAPGASGAPAKQTQTFDSSEGPIQITPIYHATTMIEAGGKVILVDPAPPSPTQWLQPADLILITDIHGDHMNKDLVAQFSKPGNTVIAAPEVTKTITQAKPLANGAKTSWDKWTIEAVPAYNIVRKDPMGNPYHPKGRGNGYVLTYGGKRIYFSGDTENIPEMKNLQNIDVAFLCMNLPFTMTPEEAADAALVFKPKVVYPYHYGQYNIAMFLQKVNVNGIDGRALNWYPQFGPNGRGSQSQAPAGGAGGGRGRGAN